MKHLVPPVNPLPLSEAMIEEYVKGCIRRERTRLQSLIRKAISGMNHSELNDFAENLANAFIDQSKDDEIFAWKA